MREVAAWLAIAMGVALLVWALIALDFTNAQRGAIILSVGTAAAIESIRYERRKNRW